jgi:hypothetical protein
MKGKFLYFISNVLMFLLLLWFARGKSGGDIFLILSYSVFTIVQILFCIFFTRVKENVIGIIWALVLSFILFKIVDNQQSKQEIKMIDETLKMN